VNRNKQRRINERSLANLNPKARDKGKQDIKLSLRPETIAWLKTGGNASERVDFLVDAIRAGELVWKKEK
jgi:hypothetical protein